MIEPLLRFLDLLVNVVVFAIIGRAILSWFIRDPSHPLMRILTDVTEPILGPIRRQLPSSWTVDLSPMIAIIVIQVLWNLIISFTTGS